MPTVLIKKHLMAWVIDEKDAAMLLDIPSPMNNVMHDQVGNFEASEYLF